MANNMPSWMNDVGLGAGIGSALGGGLFGAFGAQNPASSAMPYEQQGLGNFNPYMQAGAGVLGQYGNTASALMSNPGAYLNQIGSNFHSSPGFNFAMRQAMMGANQAGAAGGMAGSPMQNQLNQQMATNLANQNYYNYTNQAQGLLGQGLQSGLGLGQLGMEGAMGYGNILGNEAQLQYAGQMAKNAQEGSGMGSMLGGLGGIAGLLGHFL